MNYVIAKKRSIEEEKDDILTYLCGHIHKTLAEARKCQIQKIMEQPTIEWHCFALHKIPNPPQEG